MRVAWEEAQRSGKLSARQSARIADMSLLLDVVLKTNTLRWEPAVGAGPTSLARPVEVRPVGQGARRRSAGRRSSAGCSTTHPFPAPLHLPFPRPLAHTAERRRTLSSAGCCASCWACWAATRASSTGPSSKRCERGRWRLVCLPVAAAAAAAAHCPPVHSQAPALLRTPPTYLHPQVLRVVEALPLTPDDMHHTRSAHGSFADLLREMAQSTDFEVRPAACAALLAHCT